MEAVLDTDIQNIHQACFEYQAQGPTYNVERGLFGEFLNGIIIDAEGGYNYILRGPGKNTLIETITEKALGKNGADIIDIGCGAGRFLIDSVNNWPGSVRARGLTAFFYDKNYQINPKETTKEALARLSIEVKIGDAQRLTKYFSPEQFDIATAVYTAIYLVDPLALLTGIHSLLKFDGIGYIHRFFPFNEYDTHHGFSRVNPEDQAAFRAYFERDERFEIRNGFDLVYRKTKQDLKLPLTYKITTPSLNNDFRYCFL